MKSLLEWEEEWQAMFCLHHCNKTPDILEEWNNEKKQILKMYDNPDSSKTIIDLYTAIFELHISVHKKWLLHQAVNMNEPENLKYLSNLTHKDDRIFSLETELMGYEIMMSLPPEKRRSFWMRYYRRFQDKSGGYIFYLLIIKVHKFNMDNNPCMIEIETKRLPRKYNPDKIHYREFSHDLKQNIKQEERVLKKLSKRQKEILELAHEGYTTAEISLILKISPNTVKNLRKSYLKKLNVSTTNLAYTVAHKQKLI